MVLLLGAKPPLILCKFYLLKQSNTSILAITHNVDDNTVKTKITIITQTGWMAILQSRWLSHWYWKESDVKLKSSWMPFPMSTTVPHPSSSINRLLWNGTSLPICQLFETISDGTIWDRYYTVDITQDTASGSLPKPHSQNFKHLSEMRWKNENVTTIIFHHNMNICINTPKKVKAVCWHLSVYVCSSFAVIYFLRGGDFIPHNAPPQNWKKNI